MHGAVSREMWHELWPQIPVNEIPITAVTNGVHLPSWLNGDLASLFDQYLEPDWREYHANRRHVETGARRSPMKSCSTRIAAASAG